MKKYLFLIGLFIIYLILITNKPIKKVISYDDKNNQNVSDVIIKFENGINSKKLINLFDDIQGDYYVYEISYDDKNTKTSCSNISDCINDIYVLENNSFSTFYITTGFSVKEVSFLSDKSDIINYLNENKITYELK